MWNVTTVSKWAIEVVGVLATEEYLRVLGFYEFPTLICIFSFNISKFHFNVLIDVKIFIIYFGYIIQKPCQKLIRFRRILDCLHKRLHVSLELCHGHGFYEDESVLR